MVEALWMTPYATRLRKAVNLPAYKYQWGAAMKEICCTMCFQVQVQYIQIQTMESQWASHSTMLRQVKRQSRKYKLLMRCWHIVILKETSLPHMLQAMSNISPQTKIIVLVPPEPTSPYPSPSPSLLGSNVLDGISSPQTGIQNPPCQCQSQSTHLAPNNVQALSRWTVPGSFSSGCPSHKISTPSGGSFSGIRW